MTRESLERYGNAIKAHVSSISGNKAKDYTQLLEKGSGAAQAVIHREQYRK
ncbi:hypothetical protein X777_02201 [Ooceraea biroi]|uniref:Uncharacterized protein n=1 Tax=Ooceraea biroi TaxID=2015173 RepID=A0A026VSW7_OOCBI|nr:hypothetical protein X777_02201 [Ooceraea biroi]